MMLEAFRRLVREARAAHPQWLAVLPDASPSVDEIAEHESQLGVRLPGDYLDFLREFGGGDFALLTVYSMDRTSDLDVVVKNSVTWLKRPDFVAVSDNGAGDFYGFAVRGGVCVPAIMLLDHESGELRSTGDAGWFEFVIAKGLRP